MRLSRTFKLAHSSGGEREALRSSNERRFEFSFRPCDPSTSIVSFGSPYVAHDEAIISSDGTVYTKTNSVPSTTQLRITCPRPPGVTQDQEVLDLAVRYEIHATVCRYEQITCKTIAETFSEICILDDSLGAQPPTCTTDFGKEYCLFQEATSSTSMVSALRRRIWHPQTNKISWSVLASEPRPIIIRKTEAYATTAVPLVLRIPVPNELLADDERGLTQGTVVVGWQIRKSSFCAFEGLREIPTLAHVTSSHKPESVVRSIKLGTIHTYKHDLLTGEWTKNTNDEQTTQNSSGLPEKRNLNSNIQQFDAAALQPGSMTRGHQEKHSREWNFDPPSFWTGGMIHGPCSPTLTTETSVSVREALDPKPCSDNKGFTRASVLSTKISLPIHVERESLPAPTAFTPYVATRYSLLIHIKTKLMDIDSDSKECSDDSNISLSTKSERKWYRRSSGLYLRHTDSMEADLEVPLQIVYDSSSVTFEPEQLGRQLERGTLIEACLNSIGEQNLQSGVVDEEVLPSYSPKTLGKN